MMRKIKFGSSWKVSADKLDSCPQHLAEGSSQSWVVGEEGDSPFSEPLAVIAKTPKLRAVGLKANKHSPHKHDTFQNHPTMSTIRIRTELNLPSTNPLSHPKTHHPPPRDPGRSDPGRSDPG